MRTLPGFTNAHSHAFQRALRGRVERVDPARPHDDFWTWREAMYRAATALDPDGAYTVARQLYGEMLAAGYTAVGEFHYPHHQPGGTPYPDPNAMARATVAAARDAGIEIVLLMCAYARAGAGLPPTPGQRRFCDPDVATYLERVEALRRRVRRRARAAQRAGGAARLAGGDRPLRRAQRHGRPHPRQRAAARDRGGLEEYGLRPIELLADIGLLGPRTTVIHATHVTERRAGAAGRERSDRVRLPHHRGQPGRRVPARRRAPATRHPGLHRQRLEHGRRPDPRAAGDRGLRAEAGGTPERAGTAR